MNVKLIRFALAGEKIFRRRGIGLCGKERDEDGIAGVNRAEGTIVRDLRQFRRGPKKGRDLESERFSEMPLNFFAQQSFVLRAGFKDDIAAGDEGLDGGQAEHFKLAPQALHFDGVAAHVDRAEKSEISRHALLPPNDGVHHRSGAARRRESHFGAAPGPAWVR